MSYPMIPVHHEVVLNLPKKHPEAVITANTILAAIEGNTSFTNASGPVAAAKTAVLAYSKAVTNAKNRVPGAVLVRGEARVAMVKAFGPVVAVVQAAVDAQLDQAATIAESAKLKLRKRPSRNKPDFAAYDGALGGQVQLVARAVPKALLYFWEMSTDGKTFAPALDTSKASAVVSGLTVGQSYSFRFRVRTRKGLGDYSQIVTHVVR